MGAAVLNRLAVSRQLVSVAAALAMIGLVPSAHPAARATRGEPRIAFVRELPSGDEEIWAMSPDGSGQQRIGRGFVFDWAPDGGRLVIGHMGGLDVVAADGSGRRRLVSDDDFTRQGMVDWAPNGQRIVFSSWRDGDRDLYAVDANGTGIHDLTRTKVNEGDAVWSPDGRSVAFTRARYLHVMNADGGGQRPLARGALIGEPAWSPDGLTIAYQQLMPGATHFWEKSEIRVIGVDGTGRRLLSARFPDDAQRPRWSPDGRRLLFVCQESCGVRPKIYVLALGTGGQRFLARGLEPAWAPDGKKIAYTGFSRHNYEIYSMSAAGRAHTNLTRTARGLSEQSPSWAPSS